MTKTKKEQLINELDQLEVLRDELMTIDAWVFEVRILEIDQKIERIKFKIANT